MNRVMIRTSAIYIATGDQTRVFHSVEEVPCRLRQMLRRTTRSKDAATILIADRLGKQELLRSLLRQQEDEGARNTDRRRLWRHWAGLVATGVGGLVLWLLATVK